ncbi:MAG: phosphatidate cytidylyltransferase [Alphaproteobacteria bacterium]|nr:phosphatidate cytidylyltransferase [Alphaproteobacteria bacterium]MBQ8631018.1 phosphatidate cytidylyltransferase [Alphaproteobacteria bacterium]
MLKQLIAQIQARKKLRLQKSFKKELFRKSIHLSSLWIPALIYFTHPGFAIMVFSVLFVGNTILEYANYKRYRWARKTFGILFFRLLRNKETRRQTFQVSGSMYVLMAAIACTLMFSKPVAVIALTVMLVSDTCAALFGKAYGTRKLYKQKSLEGTAAFFMSALLINMCYEPIYHFTYAGVIACLAATFAEMFEDRIEIDDNLSIPVVIGIVLTLLG